VAAVRHVLVPAVDPDATLVRRPLSVWARLVRNPRVLAGAGVIVALALLGALAPLVAPYDPNGQVLTDRLRAPSLAHPLGTDGLGRDVLSRAIWGARISLTVGIAAVLVTIVIGTVVGLASGYLRGLIDGVLMRTTDVFISIPGFLLLLTVVSIYGSSIVLLILFLGAVAWPTTARLVRSEVLSISTRDFVTAARVIGARDARIMGRHIFPNVVPIIVVNATLLVGVIILIEAGLSYFGLGVPPPTPTWGGMVADGRVVLDSAWWVTTVPGLLVVLIVLAFNVAGDGLRDVVDPRRQGPRV
jgi:peptide/nickel transport system permease protein